MADTVINVTAYFPGALQQAAHLATMGGTIVVAGEAHGLAANFEPDLLFLKELTVRGVRGRTSREIKKGIALLESGRYPLHKLATHTFTSMQPKKRSKPSAVMAIPARSTFRCCRTSPSRLR